MMKTLLHLLLSTIAAALVLFCTILGYQNATMVQLNFFGAKSIAMPLGFLLVSAIALGLLTLPLILSILNLSRPKSARRAS